MPVTTVTAPPRSVAASAVESSAWRHSFPSADLVGLAADLLPAIGRWGSAPLGDRQETVAPEGPRTRIVVGPGLVAVERRDLAAAERSAERARQARRRIPDLLASEMLWEDRLALAERDMLAVGVHGWWRAAETYGDQADLYASLLEDRAAREARDADPDRPAPGRRQITAWSAKSRARMVRRLAELDFAPMVAAGRQPAMMTLTYPGDWQAVAPSAKVCKRHLDTFRKRYERRFGETLAGIWKREFQRRGAPHYHLFMVPPAALDLPGFRAWVGQTWADIVGHPDPDERALHAAVGTAVDPDEGARCFDPRRAAVYFSKHGSYAAKEYQNHAPALWLDNGSVGRFWGYWGLSPATRAVEVAPDAGIAAARVMRRYQRANGFRVQRDVWRTNTRTGVQRKRRSGVWAGSRMRGHAGFIVVNDGPAFAADLSRYLAGSRAGSFAFI